MGPPGSGGVRRGALWAALSDRAGEGAQGGKGNHLFRQDCFAVESALESQHPEQIF